MSSNEPWSLWFRPLRNRRTKTLSFVILFIRFLSRSFCFSLNQISPICKRYFMGWSWIRYWCRKRGGICLHLNMNIRLHRLRYINWGFNFSTNQFFLHSCLSNKYKFMRIINYLLRNHACSYNLMLIAFQLWGINSTWVNRFLEQTKMKASPKKESKWTT